MPKILQNFKNAIAHPLTTLYGLLVGGLTAGITAAATQFASSGNVTDWKPYALAATNGVIPVVIGALCKDPVKDAPPPTEQLVNTFKALASNAQVAQATVTQYQAVSAALSGALGAAGALPIPSGVAVAKELATETAEQAGTAFAPMGAAAPVG